MKTSKTEIVESKSKGIAEARRYLANAKETIAKSSLSETGRTYLDAKYVREGCGIGYLAALKAIDAYLIGRGIPNEKLPKSIEEYWAARKKIPQNGKFTESLTLAYQNLHIGGYYQGIISVDFIKQGLKAVQEIITMMEN